MKIKNLISIVRTPEFKRIIAYVFVGTLTTAVNFAAFFFLYYICGISINISNSVAIFCAVLFAYISNRIIVFKSRTVGLQRTLKEMAAFFLARALTMLLEIVSVFFFCTILTFEPIQTKICLSIVVLTLNYIFSKFFVFKPSSQR